MSEPKRPAPSTAATSPESSGSEAAQRAARKVSGKLLRAWADTTPEWGLAVAPRVPSPEEIADLLRRAADALEAARELLKASDPSYARGCATCWYEGMLAENQGGEVVEIDNWPHTPDCPWARLRDLLGEDA